MHRPPTPEEVDAFTKHLLEYLRSFRDPAKRRGAIRQALIAGVTAAIVGLVGGALVGIGQSRALGLANAWKLYGHWWVAVPLLGVGALAAFFLLLVVFYALPNPFAGRTTPVLTDRGRSVLEAAFGLLVVAATVGLVLFVVVGTAYDKAKSRYPLLAGNGSDDVLELLHANADQSEALQHLQTVSKGLLAQLDQASSQLSQSRASVQANLDTIAAQTSQAESAAQTLRELATRQGEIELQARQLSTVLQGNEPITRSDLDRSGRQGLWIGGALGFATSIAASAVLGLVSRALRARRRRVRRDA